MCQLQPALTATERVISRAGLFAVSGHKKKGNLGIKFISRIIIQLTDLHR